MNIFRVFDTVESSKGQLGFITKIEGDVCRVWVHELGEYQEFRTAELMLIASTGVPEEDEMDIEEYRRIYGKNREIKLRNSSSPPPGPILLSQLQLMGLPEPAPEYRFHPERQWRVDFAWPDELIACEIEGGIWMQTKKGRSKGHAHPKRFLEDMVKYNELAILGWRLIRVTPEMVKDQTAVAILERILRP